MIYLTYNDPPSGIYFSQVTDVCNYWRVELGIKVRLIAIISLRDYFYNRKKIKRAYTGSCVLPMFPGPSNWRWNALYFFILLFFHRKTMIGRGPFATLLALKWKRWGLIKKVIFDARGAYKAEFQEYNVSGIESLRSSIDSFEKQALFDSDERLAVSEELRKYWVSEYNYKGSAIVIPCTYHSVHFKELMEYSIRDQRRTSMGYSSSDIVLVYAGSISAWQSARSMMEMISGWMESNASIKLLVLTSSGSHELISLNKFPDRLKVLSLPPDQIGEYLQLADYGLLVRECSITNSVASPVKFAEYLASGIPVLISEKIGDYSKFVMDNQCGYVVDANGKITGSFKSLAQEERTRLSLLSKKSLSKNAYKTAYLKILSE